MGNKIELIFGFAEHTPGQLAVRFKLDGQEFNQFRDAGTADRSRAALVLETNARKSGFYWTGHKVDPTDGVTTPVNLFMTDPRHGTYPEQARQLVDRFRDQEFDVSPTGGYLGGAVLTSAELVAMDANEFYGRQRDEALYVDARDEARAAAKARAAARLSAAALAEQRLEAIASSANVFPLRVTRVSEDHGDTWLEPEENEPAAGLVMR